MGRKGGAQAPPKPRGRPRNEEQALVFNIKLRISPSKHPALVRALQEIEPGKRSQWVLSQLINGGGVKISDDTIEDIEIDLDQFLLS